MNEPVSDEILNAFIDGELGSQESEQLLARMREDEALSNRVCVRRNLKNMVQLAYANPPGAVTHLAATRFAAQGMARFAAVILVLALGLGGGWFMRDIQGGAVSTAALTPASRDSGMIHLSSAPDPTRVMLHVDSVAPDKFQAVLDRAERFLDEADQAGRPIQLVVIANGRGLELLRAGYSPQAARIALVSKRHTNIHFIACNQSIARFEREGQHVVLLPEVKIAPTAIGEIVTRLQQGWTYVKV